MTRDDAANIVRHLADRNEGKVSFRSFIHEAGISEHALRRAPWFPGWNAFLEELGHGTNAFSKPSISDEDVASSVAKLILQFERWPTEDQFARAKKLDNTIPDVSVIRKSKRSGNLLAILSRYQLGNPRYETVRSIASDEMKKRHQDPAGPTEVARVRGYVYMLESRRRYKIGHTNSPTRRHREVSVNVPDPTKLVHTIETDDPRGIEGYWHTRFCTKRITGTEWFNLDADDVRAFKRRDYQ